MTDDLLNSMEDDELVSEEEEEAIDDVVLRHSPYLMCLIFRISS